MSQAPAAALPAPAVGPLADPARVEEIARAVQPASVAGLLVTELVVLAVAWSSTYLPGSPSVQAPGVWAGFVCLLWAAQIPSFAMVRAAVAARDAVRFRRSNLATNILQVSLIGVLCWCAHPAFTILGVLALCASLFNDAALLYDELEVRIAYAIPLVGLTVAAFAVEGVGPRAAAAALVCGACAIVSQFVIHVVGSRARELAQARASAERLARQAAVLQREREVLRQACNLLTLGIASASLAHDLRNAVFVLSLSRDELRALAEGLEGEGRGPEGELLRDTVEAIDRLEAELARRIEILRASGTQARVPAVDLLARARAEADERLSLERAPALAGMESRLADAEVYAGEGHVSAISNLLINSARYGGGRVEARGERVSPHHYRLALRDFGVAADERARILQRIRESFDFRASPDRFSAQSGYGVALGLARLEMLRLSGAMHVREPEAGPGIEVNLVFLTTDPDALPADAPTADAFA